MPKMYSVSFADFGKTEYTQYIQAQYLKFIEKVYVIYMYPEYKKNRLTAFGFVGDSRWNES